MRFLRSPRHADPSAKRRRQGPWRRWALRSLAGLAGLVALLVVAVLVLVQCLDRPWLKRRVQELARTSAGVDIDYRAARIGWLSGAEIEGLVVRSPRKSAPSRPISCPRRSRGRALVAGRCSSVAALIERLTVSEVTLTVVVDEHGQDVLRRPAAGRLERPRQPPVPLSAAGFVAPRDARPRSARSTSTTSRLPWSEPRRGTVSERTECAASRSHCHEAEPARGRRAQAGLGSPAAPLELGLSRRAGARRAPLERGSGSRSTRPRRR